MLKIACALSNRCTYYRQKKLFLAMQKDKDIDLTLFITSSLLEKEHANTLNEIGHLFNNLVVPMGDYRGTLRSMAFASATLSTAFSTLLDQGNYDCCLAIADRWELASFGLSAALLNIPLIHIQGLEVSGNIDDKVRNALSALADLHLVSHWIARDKAEHQGVKNVHLTGCTSLDLVKEATEKSLAYEDDYIIGMFHPHTKEIDDAEEQTAKVLLSAKNYCDDNKLKLYWFAPNNDPGYKLVLESLDIIPRPNMSGEDFYRLLAGAKMIVGNSSCGIREASFLGVPCVNVGKRQEGRVTAGNVLHCGFDNIVETIWKAPQAACSSTLFGDGNSVPRIIKIIKEEYNG